MFKTYSDYQPTLYPYRGYEGNKYHQKIKNYFPNQNNGVKKWAEDIECVMPSSDSRKGAIYVSNVEAAENINTLTKLKIQAVMTCARGYEVNIPKDKLSMYKYFPCDDKQSCVIETYFDEAVDFIMKALETTNVLIHCIAGVSRSVSMVIAYLIREKNMTYHEAYTVVKARRKIIHPNDGFIAQLKKYQQKVKKNGKKLHEQNSTNISFVQQKQKQKKSNFYLTPQKEMKRKDGSHMSYSSTFIPVQKYESTSSKTQTKIEIYGDQKINFPKRNSNSAFKYSTDEKVERSRTFGKNQTKNPQYRNNTQKHQNNERGKYFAEMNIELNKRLDAIHQKYEKLRQNIETKRGSSTNNNHPSRNSHYHYSNHFEEKQISNFNGRYGKNFKYPTHDLQSQGLESDRIKLMYNDNQNRERAYNSKYFDMINPYQRNSFNGILHL